MHLPCTANTLTHFLCTFLCARILHLLCAYHAGTYCTLCTYHAPAVISSCISYVNLLHTSLESAIHYLLANSKICSPCTCLTLTTHLLYKYILCVCQLYDLCTYMCTIHLPFTYRAPAMYVLCTCRTLTVHRLTKKDEHPHQKQQAPTPSHLVASYQSSCNTDCMNFKIINNKTINHKIINNKNNRMK